MFIYLVILSFSQNLKKKKKEVWKETINIGDIDIENVNPSDQDGVSSIKIQIKNGNEVIINYGGPGIRNLWLNDIKSAITNLSETLEPKVDQSNFIFNRTEPQPPTKGSISRQKSKGRLSFNRKSIYKYNDEKNESKSKKEDEFYQNFLEKSIPEEEVPKKKNRF